jgi:hypothetical protein
MNSVYQYKSGQLNKTDLKNVSTEHIRLKLILYLQNLDEFTRFFMSVHFCPKTKISMMTF